MSDTPDTAPIFDREVDRGRFLRWGAAAAAAPAAASILAKGAHAARGLPAPELEEATIAELQAAMTAGNLSSRELVDMYLDRIAAIDQSGPKLNSIIEVNPDARAIATRLDVERRAGLARGPLHGIPVVLKDNIDTADRMQTTAGSLALVGNPPSQDSTVARRLRQAGAVILGKANLSEWANFRGFFSSSGWSGRGGQTRNPYFLDRNPCGSSSGSGAAVSANLTAATIGTETDGSIVCPSNANGVVGIKPTVGLTSRAGVVPISDSQDTVGPHGRTVADAAAVLGALVGVDPRDPATNASAGRFHTDYTRFVDPNGLQGARIGVPRAGIHDAVTEEVTRTFEAALEAMREAGATIVDPADIPTMPQINGAFEELVVLIFEFRRDLNKYLATRSGVALDREGFPRTLAGLIAFNEAHADEELKWFLQQLFELAEAQIFDEATYAAAKPEARRIGGPAGIDAVLGELNLDALVAPTDSPAWPTDLVNGDHFIFGTSSPAAVAGYPLINVPMGNAFGLPLGITFMGTAFSEPKLIELASGFEAATQARQKPEFHTTLPLDEGPAEQALRGRGAVSRADLLQVAQPAAARRLVHRI